MIYFASDFHLGAPDETQSRARERQILAWLDSILPTATELFLVGDVFDMWFEYKTVVPKNFIRFLGKLAEFRDKGIPIHLFSGNHDIWFFDYFEKELDIRIYHQPTQFERQGKRFFIGHGDGLGPKDYGYKLIKKVFRNRFCQFLFGILHPDIGLRLASYLSRKSRASQKEEERFLGEENEWLYLYANRKLQQLPNTDFFVFGHRHLPLDLLLKDQKARYINLGEWISKRSFAVFDGQDLRLDYFKG